MVLEFHYTPEDLAEMAKARGDLAGKKAGRPVRSLLGWGLFIGLAVVLFLLLSSQKKPPATPPPPPAAPPPESFFVAFVLPFIPWVLIFGFIWFFVFRQMRGVARRAWEKNLELHQQHTLEVGDDGLRLATPLAESFWRWPNFVGMTETANLVLLHMTNEAYLMIPKRAAADAARLEELKAILAAHVSQHTNAFPVVPVVPEPREPA